MLIVKSGTVGSSGLVALGRFRLLWLMEACAQAVYCAMFPAPSVNSGTLAVQCLW